jgi:FAD/FMN-containing dehydrogenase
MKISGWGRYPKIESTVFKLGKTSKLKKTLNSQCEIIARGNARSYGDSSLNYNVIDVTLKEYFISFDNNSGLLHIQAGALLSEVLEIFIPRGWFLKITPGTKFITIGGAIAADVHGKNHHIKGCFSECIQEFSIMLEDGSVVSCGKETTPELFKATCGGMGLTGVILDAKIYLKKINSQYINQTTIKTKNLKETFEAFEKYSDKPYSVAWIDCFAKGDGIGKCLLTVGDFINKSKLDYKPKKQKTIPFLNFLSFALNSWSARVFNWLYYSRVKSKISKHIVGIDTFFYPLDAIKQWNYIYGKNGFVQYQFILPKDTSYKGLNKILTIISKSNKGSFLAVLKLYGEANDNYLSFPMKGYSLALDFKIEDGVFELLDKLDKIVVEYKGRIYLAKDARVNRKTFEKGYPKIDVFRRYRKDNKMNIKFQSLQSKRLKI